MADIFDTPLRKKMPRAFVQDPETLALINSIDSGLGPIREILGAINYMRTPDTWDNALTDELAWQNNVGFYNVNLPIEQKRALVRGAYLFHRKKGTNAAVEDLIKILFGEGRVEDWYEYGGEPGHFRVLTPNQSVTTDRAVEFIRALDSVKRLSAHLDAVIVESSEEMKVIFGFAMQTGDIITI